MGKLKTLNTVVEMRKRLDFTPGEMADLLGVNVATLYRWEAADGKLNMGPLQVKILEYLRYRFEVMGTEKLPSGCSRWTESGIRVWILGLRQSITLGGTLHGLSYLLKPISEHT